MDMSEVSKHGDQSSCWVVINGNVYDVTDFLPSHPGGAADATEEYEPVHPPLTLENELPKDKHLGPVRPSGYATATLQSRPMQPKSNDTSNSARPIELCLNLHDFEVVAQTKLSRRAWIYYSSASEDLYSHGLNRQDWKRVLFRPRTMRDVHTVDMKCTLLNHRSGLPVFIAPAALGKLGHPDGELCLARGAKQYNIPYAISTASSVSFEDLSACMAAGRAGGTLWFQLYVKKEQSETRALIRRAKALGFSALLVTVDTAAVGSREEDVRYKAELAVAAGESPTAAYTTVSSASDEAPAYQSPYSSRLSWKDLEWIRAEWGDAGPIGLKGIAAAEDAKLASEHGVDCIYLSNHGGRQLDGAPSAVRTLLEMRRYCPEVFGQCQVLVDGGIRRGSDIVKALCLGATAVGLGRPFMYALSSYGTDGVLKAIEILGHEIETTLRLLGVKTVGELRPHMVNAMCLEREVSCDVPGFSNTTSASKL